MSRITTTFTKLKDKGEKAFIPFLMVGDPTIELTKDLVLEAARNGADIIELGIPYSAPLADGPTIQKAGKRSLKHGTNLKIIFKLVEEVRKESDIPLVLMGYYNSIFNYGIEKFVEKSEEVGVDGVIIPDLPLGEDEELREYSNDLDIILLVAPTSTEHRIKSAVQYSSGFIYAVFRPGLTGARDELSMEVKEIIGQIRNLTDTPVAVGFGISTAKQAAQIGEFADGVIVGSAIIKKLEINLDLFENNRNQFISKVCNFISSLKEPLKNF